MKDEIGEVHPCSFILHPFGCEGLEGGGLVELLEFESSAGGDDEGAAGEEGFAGAREVAEEGEEAALVGVGEGFEVVENEDELGEFGVSTEEALDGGEI